MEVNVYKVTRYRTPTVSGGGISSGGILINNSNVTPGITIHNALSGLQGGDSSTSKYYHLSEEQHTILTADPKYGAIHELFDSSELSSDENSTLTIVHGKNTHLVKLTIWDPSGVEQRELKPYRVDMDTIAVNFNGDIDAGDWEYLLEYWAEILSIPPIPAYALETTVDALVSQIAALSAQVIALNVAVALLDVRLLMWGKLVDNGNGTVTYTQYGGTLTGSASRIASGVYRILHYRDDMNYYVFASCRPSFGAYNASVATIDYHLTYFDVYINKDDALWGGIFNFEMKSNT